MSNVLKTSQKINLKKLFKGTGFVLLQKTNLSAEFKSFAEVMNAVNIGQGYFPFACTTNQLELIQRDRKMSRMESRTKVNQGTKRKYIKCDRQKM